MRPKINELADEEHALWEKESRGKATEEDQPRLKRIQGSGNARATGARQMSGRGETARLAAQVGARDHIQGLVTAR